MEAISYQEIPFQTFKIDGFEIFQNSKPTDYCPYFIEPYEEETQNKESILEIGDPVNRVVVPKDKIFLRTPLITMTKYLPTYFVWVDDVEKMLQIFDRSILKCDQKIEVGIYNPAAKFLFVVNQNENNIDKFFSYNEYLSKHQHVSLIQSLPFVTEQKFKLYGYKFFHGEFDTSRTILNRIWSKSNPFKNIKDVFTDISQFKGIICYGCYVFDS